MVYENGEECKVYILNLYVIAFFFISELSILSEITLAQE